MNELGLMRVVEVDEGLTQRAFREIRAAILDGRLSPGERTSVRALSDALGISRTPVREALVELANGRMVEFERNRGVRILVAQRSDVQEIFQLRLLLEVPATHAAVPKLGKPGVKALAATLTAMRESGDDESTFMQHDWAFHEALLSANGNRRLVEIIENVRHQTRLHGISTVGRSRPLAAIVTEHTAIYDAAAAGDADGAAAAMAVHLTTTRDLLLAQDGAGSDDSTTSPLEET